MPRKGSLRLLGGMVCAAGGVSLLASLGFPCGGQDALMEASVPPESLRVYLRPADSPDALLALRDGEGSRNATSLAVSQAVVHYPEGTPPAAEHLKVLGAAGPTQLTFSFDDDQRVATWTMTLDRGDFLFSFRAGNVQARYPLFFGPEDDVCQGAEMATPTSQRFGPVVPAVGTTGRLALHVWSSTDRWTENGAWASTTTHVEVPDGQLSFVAAGVGRLVAVGCGHLVSVPIEVLKDANDSAACRTMAFGIADYARQQPACMIRSNIEVPACAEQRAAVDTAVTTFAKCEGDCGAAHAAVVAAGDAYRSCRRGVSVQGVSCGAAWHDVKRRCQALRGSACWTQEIEQHCGGLL